MERLSDNSFYKEFPGDDNVEEEAEADKNVDKESVVSNDDLEKMNDEDAKVIQSLSNAEGKTDDVLKQTIMEASKKGYHWDSIGLMKKLGGKVKNWLDRGFSINVKDQILCYFRSVPDFKRYTQDPVKYKKHAAGEINLKHASLFCSFYVEFENTIELSTIDDNFKKRHYYIVFQTKEEYKAWLKKLVAAGVTVVCYSKGQEEVKFLESQSCKIGMQGFIQKRGKLNKAFKRRFFRIEDSEGCYVLKYYLNYYTVQPKGEIRLENCKIDFEDRVNCIWNISTSKRKFILKSFSVEEAEVWISRINWFINNSKAERASIVDV